VKAYGITAYGGPDVLERLDLPDPVPGPGEVRLRVRAAAVNPVDAALRSGGLAAMFADVDFPYVPGMDASGVVDVVGPGVSKWVVGDAVICVIDHRGTHGAYSEFVVVPQESLVAKPADMEFAVAAAFLMNALTARLGLDAAGVPADNRIGVTGSSGAVGGFAVELAAARGMHVVADVLPEDRALVTGLGASDVVMRTDGDLPDYRSQAPDGFDVVLDGAVLLAGVAPAVRDGGTLVTFKPWDGQPGRAIDVVNVNVRQSVRDTTLLTALVEDACVGTITPRVSEVLSVDHVAEAHRLLGRGAGIRGRIILEF
jgi:NADPH2:quinone reductase